VRKFQLIRVCIALLFVSQSSVDTVGYVTATAATSVNYEIVTLHGLCIVIDLQSEQARFPHHIRSTNS